MTILVEHGSQLTTNGASADFDFILDEQRTFPDATDEIIKFSFSSTIAINFRHGEIENEIISDFDNLNDLHES